MKKVFTKINSNEINNEMRKDNKSMKNNIATRFIEWANKANRNSSSAYSTMIIESIKEICQEFYDHCNANPGEDFETAFRGTLMEHVKGRDFGKMREDLRSLRAECKSLHDLTGGEYGSDMLEMIDDLYDETIVQEKMGELMAAEDESTAGHKAIMERYEYIETQKSLLREVLEEQDEEFDFFAFLDEHNITNPRLVKILEREFESYWDEVAYANESAEA